MIECLSTLEIRMYKFKTEPYEHQKDAL